MSFRPTLNRFFLGSAAWRVLWLGMFASHVPATLAVAERFFTGEGGGWRLLLLALSQVFFVLKVVDVRWLRVPSDRRTVLALCVAVAFLHADVLNRARPADLQFAEPWIAVIGGSAVAVAGLLLARAVAQRLDGFGPRLALLRLARLARVAAQYALRAEPGRRVLDFLRSLAPPHAPPADGALSISAR